MRIVFIADIPYDYKLKQRPQYLFDELSKSFRVDYVYPRFRLHPNSRYRLVKDLSYWLGGFSLVPKLVGFIQYLRVKDLRAPDWIFTESIQFVDLVRRLKGKRLWFDYIDNAFGFCRLPKYCHDDFLWLQRHANYVSATSEALRALMEREDTILIPNGVNLDAYRICRA